MNSKTKKIVTIGALIAAQVIAGRFLSISLPLVKIGFAFLPLSIIAILYGPVWSGVAGAVSDVLVAMLGSYGYFPPITISAILTGVIYGVFLYRKPADIRRVGLCVLCESIFISVILQTVWLTILSGKGYFVLLPTRLLQNLITVPIHIFCIRVIAYRLVGLMRKEYLAEPANRQGGRQ